MRRTVHVAVFAVAFMFGWVPMPASWLPSAPPAPAGRSPVQTAYDAAGCQQDRSKVPAASRVLVTLPDDQVTFLPLDAPRSAFPAGSALWAWCP